uniref:Cytosolic fatty-acid binding proteins domain-containing protein n=1 Tax=Panagrolaimus sp. JU765 TaxID=591449 RepID=A0AC34R4T6_9BILA
MAVKNILIILFIFFVYNDFQNQIMASGDSEIPEKFFGSFKLEKSENFDEFLAAKGVNWFVRKMIQMSSITKIFQKSTEQPGRYNAINVSGKGNIEYKNWALNEEFEALGMDGTKHKITFGLQDSGETLTEKHIRVEQGGEEETYYYTRENDYLILRMTNNGITARRWLKLQAEKKK